VTLPCSTNICRSASSISSSDHCRRRRFRSARASDNFSRDTIASNASSTLTQEAEIARGRNLADPDIWHVSMRWHSDGWVSSIAFDPAQQLTTALANKTPAPRVAVSAGDLVGYAAVPQLEGQVLSWTEERVLINSDTHVVDCHALRLGLRGMLEFSIVGMEPGSLALCQTTVRLLADKSSFLPGKEYVASAPAGVAAAPYTVATLPTHSY
jgi:hypothetical protein